MTSDLDSGAHSAGDRARDRAYLRDFLPGIVGYLVLLAAVLAFGDLDGTGPWRFAWALLPVLPALWIVRAVVRHLRRVDEHQRELLLRGLAGGFAAAMLAAFVVGFLGIAGLTGPLAGWIVLAVGMLGWAVTASLAAR